MPRSTVLWWSGDGVSESGEVVRFPPGQLQCGRNETYCNDCRTELF